MAFADALIADIDNNPPTPENQSYPGFVSAFWDYPKAEAYAYVFFFFSSQKYVVIPSIHSSAKGFVYAREAKFEGDSLTEVAILEELACARRAGDAYLKSASLYPEDDEKHPSKFPRCLYMSQRH